jgi:gas vesicle protein
MATSGSKESDMGTKSSLGSFFSGFLIGGLVSTATALLLAPQSGEETRTQIREKGIELKEKAETSYADLQVKVETAVADLRDRVDELSAKVDQAIAQGREVFSRETIDLAGEAAPDEEPAAEKVVAQV